MAGPCSHQVGDVHELEGGSFESQVGVVALHGQIDARVVDQVGNQDIFQHIQIIFTRVEINHHKFRDANLSEAIWLFSVDS